MCTDVAFLREQWVIEHHWPCSPQPVRLLNLRLTETMPRSTGLHCNHYRLKIPLLSFDLWPVRESLNKINKKVEAASKHPSWMVEDKRHTRGAFSRAGGSVRLMGMPSILGVFCQDQRIDIKLQRDLMLTLDEGSGEHQGFYNLSLRRSLKPPYINLVVALEEQIRGLLKSWGFALWGPRIVNPHGNPSNSCEDTLLLNQSVWLIEPSCQHVSRFWEISLFGRLLFKTMLSSIIVIPGLIWIKPYFNANNPFKQVENVWVPDPNWKLLLEERSLRGLPHILLLETSQERRQPWSTVCFSGVTSHYELFKI